MNGAAIVVVLQGENTRATKSVRVVFDSRLREIQQQNLSWLQWFETNSVAPFVVYYEDVVADTASVVRKIIDLLGAANEEPDRTHVPFIEKLGDEVNVEWRERFERSAPDWESWFPLADA